MSANNQTEVLAKFMTEIDAFLRKVYDAKSIDGIVQGTRELDQELVSNQVSKCFILIKKNDRLALCKMR